MKTILYHLPYFFIYGASLFGGTVFAVETLPSRYESNIQIMPWKSIWKDVLWASIVGGINMTFTLGMMRMYEQRFQ